MKKSFSSLPCSFTGAAISGNKLCIATIEMSTAGSLFRATIPSGRLEMADRHQDSTIRFRNELRAYCRKHDLQRLFLRINKSGRYGAFRRETFKIEAVLDLIPGVELHRLDPNTIEIWAEKARNEIPEAAPLRYQVDRDFEQQAIDVAAYFALNPIARAAKSKLSARQFMTCLGL